MLQRIIGVCLAILIGIGLQWVAVEAAEAGHLDFYSFTTVQWVFQIVYLILLVCIGIRLGDASNED